jgi:hypothetical protein
MALNMGFSQPWLFLWTQICQLLSSTNANADGNKALLMPIVITFVKTQQKLKANKVSVSNSIAVCYGL